MRQLRLLVVPFLYLGIQSVAQAQTTALPPYSGSFYPPMINQSAGGKNQNPVNLAPAAENCTDGLDGDGDNFFDWNDADCTENLNTVMLQWRTPLGVLTGMNGNPAPRIAADVNTVVGEESNRAGLEIGGILINTTGPGGLKQGYLRTGPPNSYGSVELELIILPGVEWSGVTAIRIQENGESYFASVFGNSISINKQNADGSVTELASTNIWDDGSPINVDEYDVNIPPGGHTCYRVALSAVGDMIDLRVSAENCAESYIQDLNAFPPSNVATLAATDGSLETGFVGLRASNDGGPGNFNLDGNQVPDDADSSENVDPSVLRVGINDPAEVTGSPKLIYHASTGSNDLRDGADWNRNPVRPVNDNAPSPQEAKSQWGAKNDAQNPWFRSNGDRRHKFYPPAQGCWMGRQHGRRQRAVRGWRLTWRCLRRPGYQRHLRRGHHELFGQPLQRFTAHVPRVDGPLDDLGAR